jgi:2-C-methyl-D-erythritol 4-phosphate cytidylyltransferase
MGIAVIIPAAGSGTRFGGDVPKQYRVLGGVPILLRTVDVFIRMPEIDVVLIAVNEVMMEYASTLLSGMYSGRVVLTTGGSERQDSIHKSLMHPLVEQCEYVLVHDAVRPFASAELIRRVIRATEEYGSAVPALQPKDTIKHRTREGNFVEQTYIRSQLAAVQTPQGFKKDILMDAYSVANIDKVIATDDAMLVEYLGEPVCIVEGEEDNIKITTKRDFQLAELIVKGG